MEQRRTKSKIATDSIGEFERNVISEDAIYKQHALAKDNTNKAYKQFCKDNGVVYESEKKFGSVMKQKYKEGREGTGKRRTFFVWY